MQEDLSQRIARLEDRAAIEELVALYTLHAAAADAGKLARLFTEEGIFHAVAGDAPQGHDALTAYFRKSLAPGKTVPIAGQLHVELDGDKARLKCLMATTFFDGRQGGFCGHYDDELRKVDGAWKFASRKYTFYHFAGGAD